MPVYAFDHVNILTGNLADMTRWYCRVLGFEKGWRPPFSGDGAWLYLGGAALVHLVEAEKTPATAGRIEHFALAATDFQRFRELLDAEGLARDEVKVQGTNIVQVNIRDPDGNHIHVDFQI